MTTENQTPAGGIETVDEALGDAQTFHPAQPFVAPESIPEIDAAVSDASSTDKPPVAGNVAEENLDEVFDFPAPKPNNNATLLTPYSVPIPDDKWDELAATIALPPDTSARTLNYAETVKNPALAEGEQGEKWAALMQEGLTHGSYHDNMLPAAQRDGANWRSRVMHGDRPLAIASPRINDTEGPLLSGERGMLRINAILGRGAIMSVPLWHSGFWVTLKMPEEVELLDTYDRIIMNKIAFGRNSNGLAFANHAVIDNAAIFDLAMRCLYETSVSGLTSIATIRSMIKAPDLHMLAWGLACAANPRGFQFERSVLDPKGVHNTVVRENLNVGSCLLVDNSSLDEWQIAHMAKRTPNSMSEESIKQYGEHFVRGASKTFALTPELGLTLKVPSVDDYLTAGQLWVDELIAAVNEAFSQDLSAKQRNEMIWDRARATSMRQYVHWIESIDVDGIEKKMVEREWITRTVAGLSSDNTIRDKYYSVMKTYINDSTVALVGVPQVHPDESALVLPRFENIIPIDPISVFFSLLSQKIQQIRMRP